ncbi:MAG: hypothetical protein NWE92_01720 [Candidatus Bathyarchaeota archaeon]|nr:hypothetical protein [Candidatus Bathyarchaeota archaeon]
MAQTSIGFVKKDEFSETNPKEHLVLLKVDGSPFDVAEELRVLSSFKEQLGCIIGCFSELHTWSTEVKEQIKDSFPSPIYDLSSNLLSVQKLQILIQEDVTLGFLISAYKALRKCLNILESIDYQLMAVDNLRWVVFLPRTLQVISSIIRCSVSLTSLASESAKSNEMNLQALQSGFMQPVSKTSIGSRSKDFLEE